MRNLLILAVPLALVGQAGPAIAQRPAAGAAMAPGTARPAGPPAAEGWTIGIGAAAIYGSAWQGSRDTALSIFPDLRVNYADTLFLSVPDGLGWNAVNSSGWKAGPLVKPRFGRDADDGGSPFQVAGGSTALRGMGDIDIAGEAGGFVEKRLGRKGQWRGRAELRQGFGGHEGLVGDVSLTYSGRTGKTIYSVGPRATFASRAYVQTYFGVNAQQAAQTGLAISTPGGGLVSYGLTANVIRPLDRRRALLLFGSLDRLGSKPAGTSLIRERGQRTSFTAGLAYSVRFRL